MAGCLAILANYVVALQLLHLQCLSPALKARKTSPAGLSEATAGLESAGAVKG